MNFEKNIVGKCTNVLWAWCVDKVLLHPYYFLQPVIWLWEPCAPPGNTPVHTVSGKSYWNNSFLKKWILLKHEWMGNIKISYWNNFYENKEYFLCRFFSLQICNIQNGLNARVCCPQLWYVWSNWDLIALVTLNRITSFYEKFHYGMYDWSVSLVWVDIWNHLLSFGLALIYLLCGIKYVKSCNQHYQWEFFTSKLTKFRVYKMAINPQIFEHLYSNNSHVCQKGMYDSIT